MGQTHGHARGLQWIGADDTRIRGAQLLSICAITLAFREALSRRWVSAIALPLVLWFAVAAAAICWSSEILAQSPPLDPKSARVHELDRLIDALANHNEPPRLVANTALFSEKYDWAEQQRVIKAVDVLVREKKKSDDVWPRLVEHIGDERYSLTCEFNGGVGNRTIGSICWDIAYHDLLAPFSGSWPNASEIPGNIFVGGVALTVPPHHDLRTWYHARQGKPLWELQVELGEWGIKTVEGLTELAKDKKAWSIQKTKATIDILRRTKKPIVRKLPWSYETKFFDAQEAKEIREEYLKRASTKKATSTEDRKEPQHHHDPQR
jgi:hypothetical protein